MLLVLKIGHGDKPGFLVYPRGFLFFEAMIKKHRRQAGRFEVNGSGVLTTESGAREHFLIKDISAGGSGVFGHCPLTYHEKVSISFQIPAFFDQILEKEAKVAWSKKVGQDFWEAGLDFGLNNPINILLPAEKSA